MVSRRLTPKRGADSQTTLVQLMEITHANVAGIVHGGEVMKLVDTAAGIAAIKHAGGMCVTVSMDEMSFLHPVHVGDLVTVQACVNDVGTTSLEIGVRVEVEDVISRKRRHTSSAYLVFVALDDHGKPRPVPQLIAEGAVERRRQREAKMRRQARLSHREAIERQRLGAPGATDPASQVPPTQRAGQQGGQQAGQQEGTPGPDESPEPDDGSQRPHLRM